jgi:hypothetical protein
MSERPHYACEELFDVGVPAKLTDEHLSGSSHRFGESWINLAIKWNCDAVRVKQVWMKSPVALQ